MTKSEIAKSIAKTAKVFSIIGIIGSLLGGLFCFSAMQNLFSTSGGGGLIIAIFSALITAINVAFFVLLKLLCYGFAEMLHNGATE